MKAVNKLLRLLALVLIMSMMLATVAFAAETGKVWISVTESATGKDTVALILTDTTVTDGLVKVTYDPEALTYQGVMVSSEYVAMHSVNAEEPGTVLIAWVAPEAFEADGFTWDGLYCTVTMGCIKCDYPTTVELSNENGGVQIVDNGAGVSYTENRVFAQFAKSAMSGSDIVLHTQGKSFGNYCYTADVVSGLLAILLRGENGEAYNVVCESATMRIAEMAQMVAQEIAGGKIQVVFDIPESALTYGYAPDVELRLDGQKLRNLGWEPKIAPDLRAMYQRMIASFRAQGF